jgi:DNA primase
VNLCKFEEKERDDIIDTAHHALFTTSDGKPGREYLKERKISCEVSKIFEIGYIPNTGNQNLSNRIIIPCHDLYGKRIAITARKTTSNKSEKPFWWNEIFEKSNHLFGLDKAKQYILEDGYAIIVEGQFDVISMFQVGIRNVVGLMGSSFKERRLALLRGYCDKVIVLLDTDINESGQKSAMKIMEYLRKKMRRVSQVLLPMDEDPDSLIRKGQADELIRKIQQAKNETKEENITSLLRFL